MNERKEIEFGRADCQISFPVDPVSYNSVNKSFLFLLCNNELDPVFKSEIFVKLHEIITSKTSSFNLFVSQLTLIQSAKSNFIW